MRTAPVILGLLGALLATSGEPRAQAPPPAAPATELAGPPELPAWTAQERAAIELLRGLRKKERPPDEELAERLAASGNAILPLLYDVLATRSVPVVAPAAGAAPQKLSEIQENVVLLALAELERDPVLRHATAAVQADASLERRAAALACVGAVGRANDLPQMFELALASAELAPDERLERELRRAVASMLERDPRGVEQLLDLRRITRPELLATLVAAIGDSRQPRGLAYLAEVAYWHEALVLDVATQVPLLGPSGDESIDAAMRVRLRPYLDEERPGPCRAAIIALAALGDEDSIAALITLLSSENDGLKQNAHWALRQLTGLSLAPLPDVWARWHQGELYWMLRQKPREFQRLQESQAGVVADALREILVHPLARKELAAALPDLLKSRFPAIRVLACRTLSDLPAPDAVGKLVWALEDPEPDVSQAAHAALRKLTRLDLPREPLAWQSATNTEPRGTEL